MKFKIDRQLLHLIIGDMFYTFANTDDGFKQMLEHWKHHHA